MVKLIIFDFFGVFRTDAYKAWLAANGYTRVGGFAEASDLSDMGAITGEEFFRRVSEHAGRSVTPEEMDEAATVDDEVVAVARELHKTRKTALLSNSPAPFVRELLKEHDLADIFDDLFISSETGHLKPSREAFETVLQATGMMPEEALFIDDSASNVRAAKEFGIHAIHFVSADLLKEELKRFV